jgi:hypothetical protein
LRPFGQLDPAGRLRDAGALRYLPIVSTLALFAALGGTATALTQRPRDSVGA